MTQPPSGVTTPSADAYGTRAEALVDRAAAVLAKTNRTVERMARQGLEPQRTWVSGAMIQKFWPRHEWIVDNRATLLA